MKNPGNLYSQAAFWISQNLPFYESWTEQKFDDLIDTISSLPSPDADEGPMSLKASRLGEKIKKLAFTMGTSSGADEPASVLRPEVSAGRLVKLWEVWERFAVAMDASGYAAFVLAAIRTQSPFHLLSEVAYKAQIHGLHAGEFYWSESITRRLERKYAYEVCVAIAANDLDRLRKLLEGAATIGVRFQKFNWGGFARKVSDARNGKLLELIWRASDLDRKSFTSREWGAFVSAAGNVRRGDLLGEIWESWQSSGALMELEGVFACARSAAKTGRADLFKQVLTASEQGRAGFQARGWNLLAKSAGELESADLFEEVWRASQPFRTEFNSPAWSSFVNAAGRVRRPDLVKEVWKDAEAVRSTFNGPILSSFANAAGRAADADLLEEVWLTSLKARSEFDNSVWSSFAHAAEMARRPDLLKEIWEACEPVRPTFDHAEWGNFIHAAHSLCAVPIMLEIFHALKEVFDPTRYTGYGTLYRPLLAAVVSCPDDEARKEMFYILRLQGTDIETCLQVMRDVAPQPIAEKGLRFEGACRSLMRYLIHSFYFRSEGEFINDVERVVDGIVSLPQDRQPFAWVHLLGRGQESHRTLLRARYVDALREVARIGFCPWHLTSEEEKTSIISDIRDQTNGGLVDRINHFLNMLDRESLGLPDLKCNDPAWQGIVDYIVSNHENYFTGVAEKDAFFKNVEMKLSECETEYFTNKTWSALVLTLITRLAEVTIERMGPELHGAAHNIVKAACRQASELLNKPDADSAIVDSIAYGIVDTIQCFELIIVGLGQRQKNRVAVNIRPVLRMFLEKGFKDKGNAVVEIPGVVRVSAWPGARRDLILRLFGSIRANVDRALQALPADRQQYRCRVNTTDGWVRFEIENSFSASRQGNSRRSAIGLPAVRRRIQLLNGRPVHPFPVRNTDVDPPIWSVIFELPAAQEEDGDLAL